MNENGGSQSFDIRLTNQQLRRDAQAAMSQFDRIGQRATQAGRSVDSSMNSMSRNVSGAITKMTQGITDAMGEMAKNMVGITALLSSGTFLKSLFDESTAFTRQMKIVSTISDEVTNDLQGYKTQVLDLCRTIAVAPETAAAALYQINSASWLGADGMKVLEASAKAAVGGVTETAVAADAITTIMNAYHLSADDAEAVSDKLFTTVRLGKTTMDELGRSIAYVAPLAATYKISIDEVLAAVAQLTKQGNSTQNAMTQISAAITAVANELGDTAFENGLLSALEEIEQRSNGSNLALKAQLSNIRAVRGALGLTKQNAAETADMLKQLKESSGAAETAFRLLNDSTGAEMRKLRTNFLKELGGIGDGMNKTLAGLAARLNAAFESGSMQTMLSVLKDLIITYGIYKTLIITVTALNKVYKNVMSQVAYQKAMAATQQKALNTAEALGAVVTTNLKRAVQALNAAIKANAFGLIIAAVAAAAYGIYKYCTRVSEAERAQKRLNDAMHKVASEVADEKKQIEKLLTTLKTAKKDSQEYKDAKQRIIDQYSQYLQGIINERGEITNLAEAYRILTEQATRAARARALEKLNEESANDLADQNKTSEAQIKKWLRYLGVSEADQESIWSRLSTAMATGQQVPQDILQHYGLTYAKVIEQIRQTFLNQTGYTPEVREANANDAVSKLRAAIGNRADNTAITDAEMARVLDAAGLGGYVAPLSNTNLLYNRYLSNAVRQMQSNRDAYDRQVAKNEQYINAGTLDRSQFEGINAEGFDADLAYLKNTVLPKLESGQYGRDGVNFKFNGTKQQTFRSAEDLRRFIQQMELEQSERQIAATLGTVGEGSEDGAAKTLEEQVQELIDQARSETDAGKLSQLKDKIDDMLKKEGVDTSSQQYKDLQAALKTVKGRLGQGGNSSGKSQAELDADVVAARQKGLNLELAQNLDRVQTLKQDEIDLQRSLAETQLEGAARRQRLRELEIEQEKLDLENQMRDRIQAIIDGEEARFNAQEEINEKDAAAHGNTHYARRTFSTGNLTAGALTAGDTIEDTSSANVGNLSVEAVSQINAIMELYKTLTSNRVDVMSRELSDEATQAYDEYLRDFGTYLGKRQALIDIANRNMAKAETEGEKKSIAAQLEKDLAALDQEANQKTSAVAQLFSDMTDKTIADMRRIEAQGRKALEFLTKGEWNAETGAELGMSEETFNTLRKSPEELEKIRKAIAAIKREADGCENGFKKFADGIKEIFMQGSDPKKFSEGLAKVSEGIQTVSQVAGFLSSSLTQLGDAFGSDALGDIANGIGIAMDAMDSAMQGAQAGAAFGPWGAAAGAAIGLVSSLGSAIAKLHDAKHEKKIQELQDQVEVLEQAYEQLDRAIDKAYSWKAQKLIEQQNVLLRQKQTLIRQQIAEEEAKKKTDDSKIKEWKKQLQEIEDQIADNKEKAIDAIFGEDVQSAIDRFAEAFESMFDGGMTRAKASKDLVKQMIKNMITEAMKADISEPMNQLREMLMGFWSDEKITDWEQNQLNNYVDNILAKQERKWGWADGIFKESTSQNSSKGGFTTMNQDSADELNGRFTALQMAGEAIKTTIADINELLKAAATRSAVTASAVDEIRGLTLLAVDHLDAIRKHTANLQEMNERLGKIEKYTSRI